MADAFKSVPFDCPVCGETITVPLSERKLRVVGADLVLDLDGAPIRAHIEARHAVGTEDEK